MTVALQTIMSVEVCETDWESNVMGALELCNSKARQVLDERLHFEQGVGAPIDASSRLVEQEELAAYWRHPLTRWGWERGGVEVEF